MGGWNSGRTARGGVVEDCWSLRAQELVRWGRGGEKVQWPLGGDVAAEVRYPCEVDMTNFLAHLAFLAGPDDDQAATQEVLLRSTPCRFGGRRWWFACPRCLRSVDKLYVPTLSVQWACRHCHGLSYRSCRDSHKAAVPASRLAKLRRMG